MEQIITRIESLHRALRGAPLPERSDELAAESLALCLRELHAIVAQSRAGGRTRRPRLRLIDCEVQGASLAASREAQVSHKLAGLTSSARDHVAETPS